MDFDQPPVRRVELSPDAELPGGAWPLTIPAVAQVAKDGLDLAKGVTFLVGENGSGKSTLVEGVAAAYGLSPEGGSTHSEHSTRPTESPLGRSLRLVRGVGASRWGFFLRAETMHGWYSYIEQRPNPRNPDPRFHELSHGESFLAVLETRFDGGGLYCLDEPEAALSFSSTLALIAVLQRVVGAGGQVLCATHSPVLAALPGARILEVGDWGLRETTWADLELVWHWKRFLDAPQAYLRHLDGD
ncbi:AAA family ATPase [Nocardioides islandensis]|uniref:AAA family ATPase n=1 Tax=Nocardioides islandensis TaxID=433663 RepID=A0A930YHS9_9ACTN|nr:AAA family ATPase [Nocardioides islandensis]MBF4763274.1 AAA family ATPase [Nocardioides islandensis]